MGKLKELPEDVKERVHFQNDIIDELCQISTDAEKADFMLHLLNETKDFNSKDFEEKAVWFYNKPRICELIEIAADYSFRVAQSLTAVTEKITEATDRLKESVGGESVNV